jgi:hypothetical protein
VSVKVLVELQHHSKIATGVVGSGSRVSIAGCTNEGADGVSRVNEDADDMLEILMRRKKSLPERRNETSPNGVESQLLAASKWVPIPWSCS